MAKKTQRGKASSAEKAKLSLETEKTLKEAETKTEVKQEVIEESKTEKVKEVIKEHKTKEEAKEKAKYLYVYGIIGKQNFDLEMKGLRNEPIKKIDFQDIGVLVSDYPVLHPAVEEKEALLHAEILNKLAQKITIVPMAFGTVFKDQEILENVLTKSQQTAKAALKLIENKIELGVKVVKKGLEDEPDGLAKEILEPLSKLAVKTTQGDKFSERLLLNNSFLVEKEKFSEFSEKIGELEEKNPELKFLYTGPWPPYSFVNIKIAGG
ncbi:MAG: GvpL/GvpF family gas vesicle protein [Nanoarchaeota archaeon]